jgi:hypothetical protein
LLKVTDDICNFHGFLRFSMSLPTFFSRSAAAFLPSKGSLRGGSGKGRVSGENGLAFKELGGSEDFETGAFLEAGAASGKLNQGGF